MTQRAPLIVVLGATACGKSRLAIELARRFKGEIISADSMQVYKGLDIVTNKVTEEEQQQAKHHLINFVDPLTRYSVVDFRNRSLDIINDLHKRDRVPIIVGGTNYYIESLLWKKFILGPTLESAKRSFEQASMGEEVDKDGDTLIESEAHILRNLTKDMLHSEEDLEDVERFFKKRIYNDGFRDVSSEKLWRILEQVDEKSAHYFHPHDKRRIIRCLQIIQESKKNYSDILDAVNKSGEDDSQSSLGGPLRFESTCVFWLDCDNKILDKVLDDRVDQMLNRGLLAELEKFHEDYNRQRTSEGKKPDYDKGIFQTIGFKEFHDYFMLDEEAKGSEEGNALLMKSIKEMKLSTRRYARKQLKWIRRRFLQSGTRDLPLLFRLETAFDEDGWLERVQRPAFDIVESFLENRELTNELLEYKREPLEQEAVNNPGKYECKVCDRVLIGTHYIEAHLKSKSHNRNLAKKQKTES